MRRFLLGFLTTIVWLAALSIAHADARAEAVAKRWKSQADVLFRHLPSVELQYAHVIAQDTAGFMWIGVDTALYRWDGYQAKSYPAVPGNPHSVPEGQIATLYADPASGLWVGTTIGGLAKYDPRSDGFVRYGTGPDGLQSANVSQIIGARQGGLWVGTAAGLDHVDTVTGAVRHATTITDRTGAVNSVVQDDRGGLWLGTERGLLHRAANGQRFVDIPLGDQNGHPIPVTKLCLDHDGRLWIGTRRAGVLVVEPGSQVAGQIPGADIAASVDARQIADIVDTGADGIWVGTAGGGVLIVEPHAGWRTRFVRHRVDTPSSLPDDDVMSLAVDRSGVIWVSTLLGLSVHSSRHGGIHTLLGASTLDRPVTSPQVSAVLAHPDGRVWLGVGDGGGIDILDPVTGRDAELRVNVTRPRTAMPAGKATVMVPAGDGTVYIATKQGLYMADAAAHRVARVDIPQRPTDAATFALCLAGDVLWVGGEDGLWSVSVAQPGRPRLLRHLSSDLLGSRRITAILPGTGHALWVGSGTGLSRVDTATGAVEPVHADVKDPNGYADGYVASLLLDRQGRLWVGSIGVGLQVLARPDDSVTGHPLVRRIGVAEGLPHINVNALLSDSAGQIWASTDNGVVVIEPRTFTVRTFGETQGVGIQQYWAGAGARSREGDLLFGGVGGLTVVEPARTAHVEPRPPVVVTETLVGGRQLPASQFNGAGAPQLVIRPGATDLTVEFAALDYAAPELNRYSYRLEGYDHDWISTVAGRRLASYTNLPPGNYTLQLRGSGPDAPWTLATLELAVRVVPAWYQAAWFYLAAVLIGGFSLIGLVQFRTGILRRRERELHALVELRTVELQQSQRQLEQLAYCDPLTGLANRRRFNEDFRALVELAAGGTVSLTLLLIDLDRFKAVNDTLGHDVGDALLVKVAKRLGAATRQGDWVARLGGDEFAVVMLGSEEADTVERTCIRIIESVGQPFEHDGGLMQVGASIGVAVCPRHAKTPDALYKRADLALYEAKHAGRNTWRIDGGQIDLVEVPALT